MLKAFDYFGSKNSPAIARWIISSLPQHDRYLEPFGGSGAIVLNKPKTQSETYSDISDLTCCFLQCLKDDSGRMIDEIEDLLYFNEDRREFVAELPMIRNRSFLEAAWFYLYCHFSRSGGGTRWNTGFPFSADSDETVDDPLVYRLAATSDRLQSIDIKQQDAFDAIRSFPTDKQSLIYADPPYLQSARKSKDNRHKNPISSMPRRQYAYEFSDRQHVELAELLQGRSAIVSGYPSALYDEIYAGWEKKSIRHGNDIEVIWISPIAMEMTSQLSLNFGALEYV